MIVTSLLAWHIADPGQDGDEQEAEIMACLKEIS